MYTSELEDSSTLQDKLTQAYIYMLISVQNIFQEFSYILVLDTVLNGVCECLLPRKKRLKRKGGEGEQHEGLPCLQYSTLSTNLYLKIQHGIGSPSLTYRVIGRNCMGNSPYGKGVTRQSNHCINQPMGHNKNVLAVWKHKNNP